jgi:hypothetical protein
LSGGDRSAGNQAEERMHLRERLAGSAFDRIKAGLPVGGDKLSLAVEAADSPPQILRFDPHVPPAGRAILKEICDGHWQPPFTAAFSSTGRKF